MNPRIQPAAASSGLPCAFISVGFGQISLHPQDLRVVTPARSSRSPPLPLPRLRHRRLPHLEQPRLLGPPHREKSPARVPRVARHAQLALLGQTGAGSSTARGAEAPQWCAKAIAACEAAGVTTAQICRALAEQDRADYRAYLIAISGGAR